MDNEVGERYHMWAVAGFNITNYEHLKRYTILGYYQVVEIFDLHNKKEQMKQT